MVTDNDFRVRPHQGTGEKVVCRHCGAVIGRVENKPPDLSPDEAQSRIELRNQEARAIAGEHLPLCPALEQQ